MSAIYIPPEYYKLRLSPLLSSEKFVGYLQDFIASQNDSSDFDFEHYDGLAKAILLVESVWYFPFIIGAVYIGGVLYLQHYMKDKKPLKFSGLLFTWNLLVGLFSAFGFWRSAPELIKFIGKPHGFYESICIPLFTYRFGFWALMFCFSKVPELNTIFVVLRKKPVEASQWFHHLVTMAGCWLCLGAFEPCARYMVVINFGVHALMYPYFALKVMGVNVPRFVAKIITTCQFAQMIICMGANLTSAVIYLSGAADCHRTHLSMWYTLIGNIAFIFIFGDLFMKLVVKPKKIKKNMKDN